ncbi:hypothetical protein [Brevibacterium ammoniilyticum]
MSIDRLVRAAEIHQKSIIQLEAGRVAEEISTLHAIAVAMSGR